MPYAALPRSSYAGARHYRPMPDADMKHRLAASFLDVPFLRGADGSPAMPMTGEAHLVHDRAGYWTLAGISIETDGQAIDMSAAAMPAIYRQMHDRILEEVAGQFETEVNLAITDDGFDGVRHEPLEFDDYAPSTFEHIGGPALRVVAGLAMKAAAE